MSRTTREWVHILLSASILLYVVTGVGIVEYNTVQVITLGLLTKDRSFFLHNILVYPFTALLFTHVYYALSPRLNGKKQK